MLDGIGKDIRLSLAVFLSVLLTAEYNGLCAVDLIDAVNNGIQTLHLLELFSIYVEQILLDGTVRPDSHNDDTSFLIMIALTVELLKHFIGSLDNSDGRAGRSDESHFLKVPVLRQVFSESIGVKEDTHNGSNRTLLAQFLSTSGSIVRHMGTESVEVCYHAVEGSAGADALLLGHFLIGNTVLAVEFSPGTLDNDIVEGGFYP